MNHLSFIKRLLLVSFILAASNLQAQYQITGNTCVLGGTSSGPYTIVGGAWGPGDEWCVTGGTVNASSNTCLATNSPSIGVSWNSGITSGQLRYYRSGNPNPVATLNVNVANNTISSLAPSQFLATGLPAYLKIAGSEVNVCGGVILYTWQKSTDGTNFTDISSATSRDFEVFDTYAATIFYRRKVSLNNAINYSSHVMFNTVPPFTPGSASPTYTTIKKNTNPNLTFTATASSGGVTCGGTFFSYSWETSEDLVTWTAQTSGPSFNLSANITKKTYVRQRISCGPTVLYTNICVVDVYKKLKGGTITPLAGNISSGTSPGVLRGTPARDGFTSANYNYQWRKSTNGGLSFDLIPGALGISYDPGNLTGTTIFDRRVECDGEFAFSNAVTINVGTVSTTNQNYIRTRALNRGGITTLTAADALTQTVEVQQSTVYFDGLGRPSQKVVKHGSLETGGSNTDMVSFIQYDNMGRQPLKFLPYASSNSDGLIKTNMVTEFNSFNNQQFNTTQGENYFFSMAQLEPSPLNRLEKILPEGNNWVGNNKGTTIIRSFNTMNDLVRRWYVTNSGSVGTFGSYYTDGYYIPGTLQKSIITDEDNKQTIEFKDSEGKPILKKVRITGAGDNGTGSGDHAGWACTYYIYDALNNLRCIVQPNAVETLANQLWANTNPLTDANILNEYCFRYEYDARNRLIMKKVPGVGEVYIVYDARNRIVMTQDAKMRSDGQWAVTLFDDFNRPVQTGLLNNTWNGNSFAQHLSAAYSSVTYPFTSTTTPASHWNYMTKTGYDSYSSVPAPAGLNGTLDNFASGYLMATHNTSPEFAQPMSATTALKGLVTWTQTKMLLTPVEKYKVLIYDEKARIIQVKSKNITSGTDISTTQYRWNGQPLITVQKVENLTTPVQTNIIVTKRNYDNLGRVIKVEKKVGNSILNTITALSSALYVTISTSEYDKLSQLKKKTVGNKPGAGAGVPLAKMEYEYNLRGWLLSVNKGYVGSANNDQYFAFELSYDKFHSIGNIMPHFNGNIGGMLWKSEGDQAVRRYSFSYDAQNRLSNASFSQYQSGSGPGASFGTSANIDFSESVSYDLNGNIVSLTRKGLKLNSSPVIDQLTYSYGNTNRLKSVTDPIGGSNYLGDFKDGSNGSADDYLYDPNGNLLKDLNKDIGTNSNPGITSYNHFNKPVQIYTYKPDGSPKGNVYYYYDGEGARQRKIVTDNSTTGVTVTTTTSYLEGAVFETKTVTTTSGTTTEYENRLLFIGHEEGRIRFEAATISTCTPMPNRFVYDYFLKDHLGNVRMMLSEQKENLCYLAASVEDATWTAEAQLYNIENTRRIDRTTTGATQTSFQDKLYQTHGGIAGQKTGLSAMIKVMAGDVVKLMAESYYTLPAGGNPGGPLNMAFADILLFLTANGHVTGVKGAVTTTDIENLGNNFNELTNLTNRTPGNSTAKAYLNWILFDDKLHIQEVGADPVGTGTISGGGVYRMHDIFFNSPISIPQNGYLYIFVSNESNLPVYFDNLNIIHTPGPILEETHYYPFGFTMQGVSSKALGFKNAVNRYKFNEATELISEFDINLYETVFRGYDPQIGRFLQPDAFADMYHSESPYAYAFNNPVFYNDPLGLEGVPYFGTAEDLLQYIQQNGIGNFPSGYINFTFGPEGVTTAVYYDPNPRVGTNKKGEKGIYISYSYANENGYIEEFRYAVLDEFVMVNKFIKAETFFTAWNGYLEYVKENNELGIWGLSLGTHDFALSVGEMLIYSDKFPGGWGWWLGENLKFNRIGWGGNQWTGSRKSAELLSKKIGYAGKVFAVAGVVVSGAQLVNDLNNGNYEAAAVHGLDTVMSVVGVVGGPVGTVVAGIYFISRFFWGD